MSAPNPIRCVVVDDDALARTLLREYVKRTPQLELVGECQSAEDAVALLLGGLQADALFLDVEMPQMTGLQFLREFLQTHPGAPAVVLVTSNRDYAKDGYDVGAVDFLLKTVEYWRFLKAVSKLEEALRLRSATPADSGTPAEAVALHPPSSPSAQSAQAAGTALAPAGSGTGPSEFLFVKVDHNLHRVRLRDILWVEALQDYVILQVGKERKIVHMTMKGIESSLPASDFVRVHRSYIVRLEAIDKIRSENLLIGEKQIPIGGTYREALFKLLNILT